MQPVYHFEKQPPFESSSAYNGHIKRFGSGFISSLTAHLTHRRLFRCGARLMKSLSKTRYFPAVA